VLFECRCGLVFFHRVDYLGHVGTHWHTTKDGQAEIMSCEFDSYLTSKLRNNGGFSEGGYDYALLDGKIVYRRKSAKPSY